MAYPKVPATSVKVICEEEVDAHLASPKSESCIYREANRGIYLSKHRFSFIKKKKKEDNTEIYLRLKIMREQYV